ncbi:MAG: glycosyltransferase family 39 protein [Chloroflexia bacterium]
MGGLRLTRERGAVLAALGSIMALGLGLRLYQLQRLSLWLDETSTIYFARFTWPHILGLQGWYDDHPPLYFALIKLVSLVVPEVEAGRVMSMIAGVATLPVLAALVARLVNWRAGLVAALVLAVSPLHVWYSQEARMYTPVVLTVTCPISRSSRSRSTPTAPGRSPMARVWCCRSISTTARSTPSRRKQLRS